MRRLSFALGASLLVLGCATSAPPAERRVEPDRPAAREAAGGGLDPAPAGMGIASEHGYISQDDANQAIGRRSKELVRCYARAGVAQEYAGGRVQLHFILDPRGATKSVYVTESALGNFEVEQCLLGVARSIQFARPEGGEATVDYSLEFRSTGERSVVDLPPDGASEMVPVLLRQVAADCQRLGVPAVAATLYVGNAAGSSGVRVRSVGFAADTALDEATMTCVSRALRVADLPGKGTGSGLGRVTITLRDAEVQNPPPLPSRSSRRVAARRPGRR